jgi:hypothetical protein
MMSAISLADMNSRRANSADPRDDKELDLRGLNYEQAQPVLQQAIQQAQGENKAFLIICIDAQPLAGEQDNFLLPISWQLTEAREQGLLSRCHLLPAAEGIKFFVEFPDSASGNNADEAT